MSKVMDVINAKGKKKPSAKQVLDDWLSKGRKEKKPMDDKKDGKKEAC